MGKSWLSSEMFRLMSVSNARKPTSLPVCQPNLIAFWRNIIVIGQSDTLQYLSILRHRQRGDREDTAETEPHSGLWVTAEKRRAIGQLELGDLVKDEEARSGIGRIFSPFSSGNCCCVLTLNNIGFELPCYWVKPF